MVLSLVLTHLSLDVILFKLSTGVLSFNPNATHVGKYANKLTLILKRVNFSVQSLAQQDVELTHFIIKSQNLKLEEVLIQR